MPDGGSGAETGGCGKGNVGRPSGGRFKDDNRLEVLGAKLGIGLKERWYQLHEEVRSLQQVNCTANYY